MKKTILTLLILINVLIVNSQTDSIDSIDTELINLRLNRLESNNEIIKNNLTKFQKQWNTGISFLQAGIVLSGFGTIITISSSNNDAMYIFGISGLISLAGSIIMIDSHKYIGRTGLNIQPGKITYTFK